MKIEKEFSRFAHEYGQYNTIQNTVAQSLIDTLTDEPKSILDLGCGNGTLVKKISWEYTHFLGIDFSQRMLDLHPQGEKIECRLGDFNEDKLFEGLVKEKFDRVFSASSLQWAEDLDTSLYQISQLNAPISLAIFTSNTFKTMLETAGISSPLRSAQELEFLIKQYFKCDIEVVSYELDFESVEEIFTYIKKSGVSGGRNTLSYKEMKALIKNYPSKTLEFEVLFARN